MNTIDNDQTNENEVEELTFAGKVLRAFDKFGDLFVLNICFFVSCIPFVTIGAAMTALYTVTNRMTDNLEGSISGDYFKAFRSNLKQGVIIWLIDVVTLLLIVAAVFRYFTLAQSGIYHGYLSLLSGIAFFLASLAIPLQFPLLARYENSVGRIMLNSLMLSISCPGTWFKLYFIWMLPIVIYYFNPRAFVYTWYLWAMILSSLFAYICSGFLKRFYARIEENEPGKKKENSESKGDKNEPDSKK